MNKHHGPAQSTHTCRFVAPGAPAARRRKRPSADRDPSDWSSLTGPSLGRERIARSARERTFAPTTAGSSGRCPYASSCEDIEAFGGLVDEPLQILGKQVSVLDKVLCRFPYLFQVHIPARVAVGEFSGSSSPLLRLFIVKDRGANIWMSVALPPSEPYLRRRHSAGCCAMRWIDDLLGPRLSALVSESNFARHHGLHEFSARRLQSGPCLFVKHRRNSYKFTCIQASERCIHKLLGGEI